MPSHRLAVAALSAALLVSPLSVAASQTPELQVLRGGALQADPVASGAFVHVPTGRVLSTWDYRDAASPQHTGTSAPVEGIINGVVRHAGHLYASWRSPGGDGGLAVYALADPGTPVLIANLRDYTDDARRQPLGIAIADGRLFLLDRYLGIFVGELDDPAGPVFRRTAMTSLPADYTRLFAFDDTLHAVGRTLLGATVLHVYDVAVPDAPVRIASHQVDGRAYQSLISEGDRVFGFGTRLTLFDLDDPSALVRRGDVPMPPAFTGARFGAHLYSFGAGPGLDVWDVADPDMPMITGQLDLRTLGTRRWLATDDTLFLPSELDMLHAVDATVPATPTLRASARLPGGSASRDMARHGEHVVLLQPDYGLSIHDPDTLAPIGRFDADLPEQLSARSFQQIAVRGDVAYLTAWGYGLITVDIADPTAPVELSRVAFPFAAGLALHDDQAYLTRSTNSRVFGVVDISDPSTPRLVHEFALPAQARRVRTDGRHAYLAEIKLSADAGATGGLRIYDLATPDRPVQVAWLDDGCHSAYDLAIDSDVALLHLACRDGLQVVDIADPQRPVVVARYAADSPGGDTSVAQRGDRAWFANNAGLQALDMTDPTSPSAVGDPVPLGGIGPARMALFDDARLVVLGGTTGVHVFDVGGDVDAIPLPNRVPATGLAGGPDTSLLFAVDVPEGVSALQLHSYGGRGDVALQVRRGQPPTDDAFDARSDRPGNNESIRIDNPAAGTWYVRLDSDAAFSGVSLQARY